VRQGEAAIVLEHDSRRLAPFDYVALLTQGLSERALTVELRVSHQGAHEVAYGLASIPGFLARRTPGYARRLLTSGLKTMPTKQVPISAKPEWDFGAPVQLPASWINACFEGWGGEARITWPARGLGLGMPPDPQSAGLVLLRRGQDAACAIVLTPFERGEFRLAGNT
jgi:aldose 1-epimerase